MRNHDGNDALQSQQRLIASLVRALKRKTRREVHIIETHISWVLIAGHFAYKIKKAVCFDFIDARSLESRCAYCHEELRLNRRLAPEIYLGVIPITGTPEQAVIAGAGTPIEYAVKMQAFSQVDIWIHRIQHRLLTSTEINQLAKKIALFHQCVPPSPANSSWGTPQSLQAVAADNFAQLSEMIHEEDERQVLEALRIWEAEQRERLAPVFENRKERGLVKENHGDLHSGNILTRHGKVEVFDCIDFNENLRWIDVVNEIAFICMDLRFQKLPGLAARLLNQYLEVTGDYEGLAVLRYYEVYRALVRCKVASLRARQLISDVPAMLPQKAIAKNYLAFASAQIKPSPCAIMITHGFSGSGKSTFSKMLVELLGAVVLRSDVERKRLRGLPALSDASVPPGSGIYDADTSELTYRHLLALAKATVQAGIPAIVDAAFLKITQRNPFHEMANELKVPFLLFDLRTDEATLKSRILSRQEGQDPSDAGLDILAHQLRNHDPLANDEMAHTIIVNVTSGIDPKALRTICEKVNAILRR